MNDPLYLEDSFVNLARVLTVFNEQNNQEQLRVVGKGRGDGCCYKTYNHTHNILELEDVLVNVSSTASEMERGYY